MAIQNQGILGGFSGKIGTVVGASWRDREVMKARPRFKRNRSKSESQEKQQARFKLAAEMTSRIENLIKSSFGKANKKTASNDAYKTILDKAITGVFPDFSIDFSKLQVARGKLTPAWNGVATSPVAGKVEFDWTDNSGVNGTSPNDKAILVVYCEELEALLFTITGPLRSAGTGELNVPLFTGKQVHTWLSFIDDKGVQAANSHYTGVVSVL